MSASMKVAVQGLVQSRLVLSCFVFSLVLFGVVWYSVVLRCLVVCSLEVTKSDARKDGCHTKCWTDTGMDGGDIFYYFVFYPKPTLS